MGLLQLPPEIFERITHFLVKSLELEKSKGVEKKGLKEALQYKKVCSKYYDKGLGTGKVLIDTETFNKYIVAEICEQASRIPLNDIFSNSQLNSIFRFHGALIMTKQIMRSTGEDNNVIQFIRDCVDFALAQGLGTSKDQEARRFQCTFRMCTMLLGSPDDSSYRFFKNSFHADKAVKISKKSDIILALAAALNHCDTLLKHIAACSDILSPACELLPNALDATVISGSAMSLCILLWYLGKYAPTSGPGNISDAARAVSNSLRLAIRMQKTKMGDILFHYIIGTKRLLMSTSEYLAGDPVKECIQHGTPKLLLRALHLRYGCFFPSWTYVAKNWNLDADEYQYLYRSGNKKILQVFLEHKIVDPNVHNLDVFPRFDITPLMLALKNGRYNLAGVLVTHGADINAKSKGMWETALIFAAKRGFHNEVRFLVSNGAKTNLTGHKEDDALFFARIRGWRKCEWLLKKAAAEGTGFIQREDIWEVYRDEVKRKVA
jgi:hypothetical protein